MVFASLNSKMKKTWAITFSVILSLIILGQVFSSFAKKYDGLTIPYQKSQYDSYLTLPSEEIIIFQKIGNYNREFNVYANSIFSEQIIQINEYNKEFKYKNYLIKINGNKENLLYVQVWNKNILYWISILNLIERFFKKISTSTGIPY